MKKVIGFIKVLFISFLSPFVAAEQPLQTLSVGQEEIIFNEYRGKVILLDFWASWCGPCRQSFPWMNDIQTRYADQGLEIIAINLDQDKQDAADFLSDVPATFKIAYDPDGGSAEEMSVVGMPMSYLIDREGNVRHRLIGFNTHKKAEHENHIKALLSK